MKFVIIFSILISGGILRINAQQTPNNAASTDASRRITNNQETANRRFEPRRSNGEYSQNIRNLYRSTALQTIGNFYRKPTKEENKFLAADKNDLKKYEQFLHQSGTGLTKLITDRGCAEFTVVLNVSEDCLKYSMPGAGASFSFRTGNYSINRLADLTFREDGFYSSGILSHAIMVDIGDVPLEQATLQTAGLKFISDFQTVTEFEKAIEADENLTKGIENGGFFYCRNLEAKENETYVLRSVAYRGSYYRAAEGFVYDELDFDERRDVTVAFRIVRRGGESVTILWKILANQKAPEIKKISPEKLKLMESSVIAGQKDKN